MTDLRPLLGVPPLSYLCEYCTLLKVFNHAYRVPECERSSRVRKPPLAYLRARFRAPPLAYSMTREKLGSSRQTPSRPTMFWCFSSQKSFPSCSTLFCNATQLNNVTVWDHGSAFIFNSRTGPSFEKKLKV
jgi:hypothetical protein